MLSKEIKMKTKMKITFQISMALLIALAWVSIPAYAGEQNHQCQGGHNCNNTSQPPIMVDQEQGQLQTQGQEQTATGGNAVVSNSAMANASNEGNTTSVSSNTENNSSTSVLVPNNNTENCLRVFGFAWGKGGESGALGIPWRSKKCDYEQAADDAFAAGERENGWFWKCENANLYKSFQAKGESKSSAKGNCLSRMLGEVTAQTTITTLTEQVTTLTELRESELSEYRASRKRLTEMCNESKDRLFEACGRK